MPEFGYQAPVAYGYCRKSTTGQREESIEAQQRAIVAYAASCGYNLVKIYKDHGNSGKNGERPQFIQMVEDATAGGAQYIIVHKLDRFFRNAERQTLVEAQLRRHGVKVLSASEHFDDTPQGQFMRNVTKAINQWYSANLAQEVTKGLRENALGARNTGGVAPLGYKVDPASGKFVIEPREAEAVQLIFKLYLEDVGYARIVDELNSRGYITRRGQPFGKNSIYDILRNEKYTGVYIWNRLAPADPDGKTNRRKLKPRDEWVCVENGMPQIISPEDFEKVQDEMNKRRHHNSAHHAKAFYLLSGLVYCGGCGGTMGGEMRRYKSHGEPVEYRYYTCSTKKRLHDGGDHSRPVSADKLEKAVVEYLQRVVLSPETMDAICAAVLASMRQGPTAAEQAADLRRQMKTLDGKIDRLYTAIENGLDNAGTVQRINDLLAQKKDLTARVAALDKETGNTVQSVEKLRSAWSRIRLDDLEPERLRVLIRDLVDKIIVYDDGPRGHRIRILIKSDNVSTADTPDLIHTQLPDLQNFATQNGISLPLPPVTGNIIILSSGFILMEFLMLRR